MDLLLKDNSKLIYIFHYYFVEYIFLRDIRSILLLENVSYIIIYDELRNEVEKRPQSILTSAVSSFGKIEFQKYSKSELEKTLLKIVNEAFYDDVIQIGVIDHIVDVAYNDGGLEQAVELLWKAGSNAENEGRGFVTVEDLVSVLKCS